jgi:hypothetical protein
VPAQAAWKPGVACLPTDWPQGTRAEPAELAAPYPAAEERRMEAVQLPPVVVERRRMALRQVVALPEATRQEVPWASAAQQQGQTDQVQRYLSAETGGERLGEPAKPVQLARANQCPSARKTSSRGIPATSR